VFIFYICCRCPVDVVCESQSEQLAVLSHGDKLLPPRPTSVCTLRYLTSRPTKFNMGQNIQFWRISNPVALGSPVFWTAAIHRKTTTMLFGDDDGVNTCSLHNKIIGHLAAFNCNF